jgi:hypothetical protein
MITVLKLPAKFTIPVRRAVTLCQLLTRGQPPPDQLPKEDLDLRGNPGSPHFLEVGDRRPVRQSEVQGLGGEAARLLQRPRHFVLTRPHRVEREDPAQILPFHSFRQREASPKADAPACLRADPGDRCELIIAAGKQPRE